MTKGTFQIPLIWRGERKGWYLACITKNTFTWNVFTSRDIKMEGRQSRQKFLEWRLKGFVKLTPPFRGMFLSLQDDQGNRCCSFENVFTLFFFHTKTRSTLTGSSHRPIIRFVPPTPNWRKLYTDVSCNSTKRDVHNDEGVFEVTLPMLDTLGVTQCGKI